MFPSVGSLELRTVKLILLQNGLLNYNFVGCFGGGCCRPWLEATLVKDSVLAEVIVIN